MTGIWTAILLGTAFTGIYAWRVAEEARQLAQALAATELVLAREQHLSQLDGLAAAAAHELGTPLATIALVAKELDHDLPKGGPVAEDLQPPARAGRALPHDPHQAHLAWGRSRPPSSRRCRSATSSRRWWRRSAPSGIAVEVAVGASGRSRRRAATPASSTGSSNILDNAVDFAEETAVAVGRAGRQDEVRIEIRDDGPGFAPDVLLRVGEPYVTTRSAAKRRGRRGRWRARARAVHRQDPDRALGRPARVLERRAAGDRGRGADRLAAGRAFERGAAPAPQAAAGEPLTNGQAVPI